MMKMDELINTLKQQGFKGEIDTSDTTRQHYSHDASLFELIPQVVVYPKDTSDLSVLVQLTSKLKAKLPELALTARSAGTDMSGGAINDSLIVAFGEACVSFLG